MPNGVDQAWTDGCTHRLAGTDHQSQERYFHSTRSEWLLQLLSVFPTPAAICALPMSEFVQQAWTLVGRKVSKQRLLEGIYRTARSSVGLPVSVDSEAVAMFRLVLREMRRLRFLFRTQSFSST